ncbi:conserved hypothetical protein [Aliivibrio fischeri MJ11]|uniref:Uncharacterized protein n=1 Tax=Aliivibrio fischeri (strain MJ11) TaxID=388396 RepID=B5EU58_ALIFM|nr:hypothetical protein [Aliivibrio fischeri]ACH64234.1 conserved hypothetical protein [Aliivibrio fischeri MJ11]
MEVQEVAFYLDPRVWSATIAFIALVLSQLPPIHKLFRRGKLELDVYEKVGVSHMLGNPNMQLHIILNNSGGKPVTITGINISLMQGNKLIEDIQAKNYIKTPEKNGQVLLTKFKLKPDEEWGHLTSFYNDFSQVDERLCKSITKRVRDEISEKIEQRPKDSTGLVEISDIFKKEIDDFFTAHDIWTTGEYKFNLTIQCADSRDNISKSFRFTLYESDSDELKEQAERYKYGEGICYTPADKNLWLLVKLEESNT